MTTIKTLGMRVEQGSLRMSSHLDICWFHAHTLLSTITSIRCAESAEQSQHLRETRRIEQTHAQTMASDPVASAEVDFQSLISRQNASLNASAPRDPWEDDLWGAVSWFFTLAGY